MREDIAQTEVTPVPLCHLSLDFEVAFNKISHQVLFTILRIYGFSDWFVERRVCIRKPHAPSELTVTYLIQTQSTAQLDRDAP